MLDKFHILSFQCFNLLLLIATALKMIHKYCETRINKLQTTICNIFFVNFVQYLNLNK